MAGGEVPAAVSAARPHHDARSVLQHRLPVRGDLSERRRIPAGPGVPTSRSRSCAKAIAAMPQKWQYYHDIGFVYYWRLHDYQGRGARGSGARPRSPTRPTGSTPLAASMLTRGQDRAAARFLWQQILQVRGGVAAAQRRARAAAAGRAGPDRSADAAIVARYPPAAGRAATPGRAHREAGAPSACRSTRPGPRSTSIRPPGASTCLAAVAAVPDARTSTAAAPVNLEPPQLTILVVLGLCRRQLSQRLRPPHPAAAIALATPARAARAAATRCAGSTTSRWRATRSSAAAAGSAACRSPSAIPAIELATMALFVLHGVVFGWTPLLVPRLLFACAMVVLFAIDLEHHLLPDVITLPGIALGLISSTVLPPGLARRAHRHGGRRGGAVASRRGILPILRAGRHGRRGRQDAGHGRRVPGLEARARSPWCSRRSPGRSSGSSSSWPGGAA